MPFSFNPGQQQPTTAAVTLPTTKSSNDVPALVVPEAPTISLIPVVKPISPFAFRNDGTSKTAKYFQFLVFVIFLTAAVASFLLFSYQSTLKVQISNRKATLEEIQKGYTALPIDDMQKLSSRLVLINKIMNERASVRTALIILEESVDNRVTYNKFSLAKNVNENNVYNISFGGETNSYASLYQQLDILKGKMFGTVFKKIIIGGLGPLDKRGIVGFRVDGDIAIAGIDPDGFTIIHKNSDGSIDTTSTDTSSVDTQPVTTPVVMPVIDGSSTTPQ